MSTPRTMANAAAYVAITGWQRAMHWRTRFAIGDLIEVTPAALRLGRCYHLTAAGLALLDASPLWRAHLRMIAAGLDLARDRRQQPGRVSYTNAAGERGVIWTKDGRALVWPPLGVPGMAREV